MRPNYFWKSIHIIRKINNKTLKLFQTIRMLIMVKIILVIIEISRPPRGQFCRVMVHQYDLWRPRKASQPFGPAPQQINQIQQIINRKISLWADTKEIFGQEQIVIERSATLKMKTTKCTWHVNTIRKPCNPFCGNEEDL